MINYDNYMTDFFLNLNGRRKFQDVYNGKPTIQTPDSIMKNEVLAPNSNYEEEVKKIKKMFYMAWYFTVCGEKDKGYVHPSGDHSDLIISLNEIMNTMLDVAGVDDTKNALFTGFAAAAINKLRATEPRSDGKPDDSRLHNLYIPNDFIIFSFDLLGTFENLFSKGYMFNGDNSDCDWTVAYYSGKSDKTKFTRHLVIYNQHAKDDNRDSMFDAMEQKSNDDRPYLEEENIIARHIDDIDIEFLIRANSTEFVNAAKMTAFRPYDFPDFDGKNQKLIDDIREMVDTSIDKGTFAPYVMFFSFFSRGERIISVPMAPRFFDDLDPIIKEKMKDLETITNSSKAICPFTMNVETSVTLNESKLEKEMNRIATLIAATAPPDTWSYENIHDKTLLKNIVFSSPDMAMEHFDLIHFFYQDSPRITDFLEKLEGECGEIGGDED